MSSVTNLDLPEDRFDWAGEAVVVPESDVIAVYFDQRGEVILRKKKRSDEDQDTFVNFPVEFIPRIMQKLEVMMRDGVRETPRRATHDHSSASEDDPWTAPGN